jgi:23S rRNA pseudouridine2605 synthase
LGYCSRSQAAALIQEGRVSVEGRAIGDPGFPVRFAHDRMNDQIEVDGVPIQKQPRIYLVMNKPRGLVTTASDEKGRNTIYDLLNAGTPWVGPVGRLDKASEGLLLLTNDSEWADRITDPASHLDKVYHVQIDCMAGNELLARIVQGRSVGNERLRGKSARLLRHGDKNSWLEITLNEGKNRQIRRLMEALDIQVLRLIRTSIGPLSLGNLAKGGVRPLTKGEKQAIDRALVNWKNLGLVERSPK